MDIPKVQLYFIYINLYSISNNFERQLLIGYIDFIAVFDRVNIISIQPVHLTWHFLGL